MLTSTLPGLEAAPIVIEPDQSTERPLHALLAWAEPERVSLDQMLHRSGAILFRGFDIDSPEDLAWASAVLGGEIKSYVGGDSPRTQVADKVYNSTDFPPHLPIGLHNELSYAGWWPSRIFFHCKIEPTKGGETPIGDSRAIYRSMPEDIRRRFETEGVRYVQNLHGGTGPGKSWQQTFETTDKTVVEAYCTTHGMAFRWTDYGLNTSIRRQGVIQHPVTGQMAWFNQAEHWHAAMQTARFWDAAPGDSFAAHCTYGDGSEISRSDLEAVCEVTQAAERAFAWRVGDLMMLDNLICAHGRRPYAGPRKILVAMS
jgi:alpha-ketoglutarate-dependent taurine dioxygenase